MTTVTEILTRVLAQEVRERVTAHMRYIFSTGVADTIEELMDQESAHTVTLTGELIAVVGGPGEWVTVSLRVPAAEWVEIGGGE